MKKYRRLALVAMTAIILEGAGVARGSTFQIVANIPVPSIGDGIHAPLALDTTGNILALTETQHVENGVVTNGDLYELDASAAFTKARILYAFTASQDQGENYPEGLVLTNKNIMVGVALFASNAPGAVFNLGKPSAPKATTLHSFALAGDQGDGQYPTAPIVLGPLNKFYGTTEYGGSGPFLSSLNEAPGTVYSISSSPSNPAYEILYNFQGPATGDGAMPTGAPLAVDAQGTLFGTTQLGGTSNLGVVYSLEKSGGVWNEQVIHSFAGGSDFAEPTGNVVVDTQGYVYGCAQGGKYDQGGIFRLAPPQNGGKVWHESMLYQFGHHRNDPIASNSSEIPQQFQYGGTGCNITIDPSTDLIVGTSWGGGKRRGGTIFTLTPPADGTGAWQETIGFSFTENKVNPEGSHPIAAPLQVGNTYYGGTSYNGAIYAFTP